MDSITSASASCDSRVKTMDNPGPRRVFTAPTSSAPERQPSPKTNGMVETLYHHPSVKIVSFTAGPRPVFGHAKGVASTVEVEPGSLPWSSQWERTIAVGPFRIYRAPGSVAFLSCGSALQPILPKSQCWCVDEASSKYVLQVRRPQYWRIEVPTADDHDMRLALELREVLDKVLQLEKTECPFRRTFTVELPERPHTPVKKLPWTPPVRLSIPALPSTPAIICEQEPAKQEEQKENVAISNMQSEPYLQTALERPEDMLIRKVDAAVSVLEQNMQRVRNEKAALDLLMASGFQAIRSVTAPPQLTLVPEKAADSTESHSPTGSHNSFHSVEAWTSPYGPLPPSPPLTADGDNLLVSKTRQHIPSDLTITTNTPTTSHGDTSEVGHDDEAIPPQWVSLQNEEAHDDAFITKVSSSSSSSAATYRSATSSSSPVLNRRPYMRHRPTTSSSISPSRAGGLPRLPSAANLFSSYRNLSNAQSQIAPTRLSLIKRLPMAVIHKTVEILFSPPSHLINLMLKVAARITAGEWSGYVFGLGEQGERIPVHWDWSDEDDDGQGELGGWHADEDWAFGRHAASSTPLKMAGAFPESPDESDDYNRGRELLPPSTDRDESPSTSKRRSPVASEGGQGHGKHWSGSWGVD